MVNVSSTATRRNEPGSGGCTGAQSHLHVAPGKQISHQITDEGISCCCFIHRLDSERGYFVEPVAPDMNQSFPTGRQNHVHVRIPPGQDPSDRRIIPLRAVLTDERPGFDFVHDQQINPAEVIVCFATVHGCNVESQSGWGFPSP